jgi:hypothetical protein
MTTRADIQGVVKKTMADLNHPFKKKRDKAISWFMSPSREYGSFLWACSALSVAPGRIRSLVEKTVARRVIQNIGGDGAELRFRVQDIGRI